MPGLPAVLWIGGAPGAGKSVAGWALFEALAAEGLRVGYVDIDQLGMLYPASDEDPDRHLLKAAALATLVPGYGAAGVQVLVVSGVLDPQVGPATALFSDIDLTVCLLLADHEVLRERLLARGWDSGEADAALVENAALRHAPFAGARVETLGLSVAETVGRLRSLVRVGQLPGVVSSCAVRSHAGLGVIVVTGPRAVGSSTVGYGLAMHRWQAGLRTGFVDMQQLAFLAGPGSAQGTSQVLTAVDHVATMHAFFAVRGAGLLVVCGHLDLAARSALRAALPAAPVTVVRLCADAAGIEAHVRERVTGGGARLAGDDLIGAGPAHQAAVVAAALAEQRYLDADGNDEAVLDVTGRTPAAVIGEIHRLVESREP